MCVYTHIVFCEHCWQRFAIWANVLACSGAACWFNSRGHRHYGMLMIAPKNTWPRAPWPVTPYIAHCSGCSGAFFYANFPHNIYAAKLPLFIVYLNRLRVSRSRRGSGEQQQQELCTSFCKLKSKRREVMALIMRWQPTKTSTSVSLDLDRGKCAIKIQIPALICSTNLA